MKSKKLTISSLTASLLLGFAVTSFAGMGISGNGPNIGTEAGVDIIASDTAKTAAATHDYNAAELAQVGTEAGANVVASDTAKTAAANFDFNADQLAQIGTEAGYDPTGLRTDRDHGFFKTETTSEQVAEERLKDNAQVHTC